MRIFHFFDSYVYIKSKIFEKVLEIFNYFQQIQLNFLGATSSLNTSKYRDYKFGI